MIPPPPTQLRRVRLQWYSLARAMEILAVPEISIRERIAQGSLSAVEELGELRILLPTEQEETREITAPSAPTPTIAPAPISEAAASLRRLVQVLEERGVPAGFGANAHPTDRKDLSAEGSSAHTARPSDTEPDVATVEATPRGNLSSAAQLHAPDNDENSPLPSGTPPQPAPTRLCPRCGSDRLTAIPASWRGHLLRLVRSSRQQYLCASCGRESLLRP